MPFRVAMAAPPERVDHIIMSYLTASGHAPDQVVDRRGLALVLLGEENLSGSVDTAAHRRHPLCGALRGSGLSQESIEMAIDVLSRKKRIGYTKLGYIRERVPEDSPAAAAAAAAAALVAAAAPLVPPSVGARLPPPHPHPHPPLP